MKHIAVKSILSVMLSLMMVVVFTPAIAFADEASADETDAVEEPQVLEPVDEPEFVDEPAEIPAEDIDVDITETQDGMFGVDHRAGNTSSAKAVTSNIKVNNISSWDDYDDADASYVSFARTDECTANGYYCVEPFEITKGVFCTEAAYLTNNPTANQKAKIALFYDAKCTKAVDGYAAVNAVYSNHFFKIPKTRKYYIAVGASATGWDTAEEMSLYFFAERFTQAKKGTTLKDGKPYAVRCGKGKTTTFKYKPTYTGYAYVDSVDELTKSTLKNSKGKTLAAQQSRNYSAIFGVKRTSYKLSVNAYKKSSSGGYILSARSVKYANQSGASKKKAKTLTEGVTKDGRINAGSSKSQWFKFKNTEKSIFSIRMLVNTNNKFKIQVYKGKAKLIKWTTTLTYKKNMYTLTATDPMPTGTYYIKVTPIKKSCGVYRVSWFH